MKDKEMIEICENCKIKENCSHRILVNMEKCKVNDCDYFQNISTDKEKQIEEMAKDKQWQRRDSYCLRIQKALQYKETSDNEDVPSILVDFEKEIRKEILPKDSVVLSREEINNAEYFYVKDGELIPIEKGRGKFITTGWYKELLMKMPLAHELAKERKETAEKIFQRLFEEHDIFNDNDVIIAWQVKDVLKRLAKQFGVEIKE